jgi:hypothetical protein
MTWRKLFFPAEGHTNLGDTLTVTGIDLTGTKGPCQPAGGIVGSGAGDSTLCVVELLEVNDDASDETVVEMVEADYSVLPPRSEPPHLPPQVQQGISRPRMTAWRSPWQSGQIIRRHPSAAGRCSLIWGSGWFTTHGANLPSRSTSPRRSRI